MYHHDYNVSLASLTTFEYHEKCFFYLVWITIVFWLFFSFLIISARWVWLVQNNTIYNPSIIFLRLHCHSNSRRMAGRQIRGKASIWYWNAYCRHLYSCFSGMRTHFGHFGVRIESSAWSFNGKSLKGLSFFLCFTTPVWLTLSIYQRLKEMLQNGHFFSSQAVSFPAVQSLWGRWAPPLERSKLISFTYLGTWNTDTVYQSQRYQF